MTDANDPVERSHAHKPRKFSTFMKRLANLKPSAGPSSSQPGVRSASFSSAIPLPKHHAKISHAPSLSRASSNGRLSFAVSDVHPNHQAAVSDGSLVAVSDPELDGRGDGVSTTHASRKSRPAPSATTATTSAWSSPTPSVRSLTTTLTTVQSTAPGSVLNSGYNPHPSHHHNPNGPPQMYSMPFDAGSPPNHPATPGLLHPVSYSAATANGVWSDNASIITLASSSKRRRRSFDTDASVRAMAPSSVWGGSRESLPLSVLSGNFDVGGGGRSIAGERASLYGSTFRSGDAASVHGVGGPTGSIMGEISGASNSGPAAGSPLMASTMVGRPNRGSNGWSVGAAEGEEPETRSLSARSASFREAPDGEQAEVLSVKDGSSNVGVWHGVPGKVERKSAVEKSDENGENGKGD